MLKSLFVVTILSALSFVVGSSYAGEPPYVLNNPWDDAAQHYLNIGWNDYSDAERQEILEHMYKLGLLSRQEVDTWPMYQVPQPAAMGG